MKIKMLLTPILLLVCLITLAQDKSSLGGSLKFTTGTNTTYTNYYAVYVSNGKYVGEFKPLNHLLIDAPLKRLIRALESKMNFRIDEIKADTSKFGKFYYLMIGDHKAWIGADRKLVVRDSIEAKRILSAAIIDH